MILCCGMAEKRMGMLGECVQEEGIAVKLETVTLIGKGR